jgi:hypothetical protein
MDALVVALCGVVAVATTIETAQTVYRHAVALYGKVHAQFNPSPVIVPTVEMAFAATDEKAIAVIVEEIQVERYFIAQFDQIDSDVLATVQAQVNASIAQAKANQLKCDRTAQANDGGAIALAKGRLRWGDRRLGRGDCRVKQRQSSSLRIKRSQSKTSEIALLANPKT